MTGVAANPIAARAGWWSRQRWLFVALWAVLSVSLFFAARGLPWGEALHQARRLSGPWVVAAVAANLAILPLWALEWRLLVPGPLRIAAARMLEVVAVTASVLNSVPFFAGEASGVALLIARGGLSRGAALSVLALDQLLVGFAKVVVLSAAAIAAPLPDWLRAGILSLLAGMAALALSLSVLAHRGTQIRALFAGRQSRLFELGARIAHLGRHLDALREWSRLWRLATLALSKKAAELAAILALQAAFGLEPSLSSGLLVLAALAITTLLPVAPANLGVYEATVFASYRFLGVPADTALGLAVVQHLAFLMPMLATGYVMLTLRQLRLRGAIE